MHHWPSQGRSRKASENYTNHDAYRDFCSLMQDEETEMSSLSGAKMNQILEADETTGELIATAAVD